MSPRGQDTMEKIQDFLETKKKYEAKLWDYQMGFFLITIIFLGVQILNSWKVSAVCTIIEICLLILCWRMERKKYGSVFCSFVHGEILGLIFLVDGWCFIGLMRKPNNYLMIGIVGTILIALCYFGRFWLVRKRIHDGWYENGKKKGSNGKEIAASVAIMTFMTLRLCRNQTGSKLESMGQNETYAIVVVLLFALAMFTSLWVDAGMMYYYFRKYERVNKK